jgi:K+-sensing histidine kinase KdpD
MAEDDVSVPLKNLTKFVRQLSHDLRNYLNAAELQAAFISEIATDDEVKSELKRLREMVGELGAVLQKLTSALGEIRLNAMPYSVRDFLEDIRQKLATDFPDSTSSFTWNLAADKGATIEIDPQLLQQAVLELFENAVRLKSAEAKIVVSAETSNGEFVLELTEPKTGGECDPSWWGREPLRAVSHGHYGLGLYRAARIVAAHSGRFETQYDRGGSCLVSTVRLPLAPAE